MTEAVQAQAGMTVEEWGDLPEDTLGELVDGCLVEEEIPSFIHEDTVAWFVVAFRAWLRPDGGWATASGSKLAISETRGRIPDVVAYFPGRRPPARGVHDEPPDIAVEVSFPTPSDARRDRVEKLRE